MKPLLLGALLFVALPLAAGTGDTLFSERCAVCHTIGGGDSAGPDLVSARRLSHGDLHAAVERMQNNAGPLTPAEVDALVAFLGGGTHEKPKPRGSSANGRQLFFGDKSLANGGSPCFACHAIEGRGGNLAKDLTSSKANIAGIAAQPSFPMMKAAYTKHAVTDAEAYDIAAFVSEARVAGRERVGIVHGAAAGIVVLAFGAVGLIVRWRRDKP